MGTTLFPVIMSGGSGTRLWPLSRQASPKQFHALASDQSLFADTIGRLDGEFSIPQAAPIVVTHQSHGDLVAQTVTDMGREANILLEPEGRNTAPAAGLAAHLAASKSEDALVLLLSADHVIADGKAFHEAIQAAIPLADDGYMVTFGIEPTGPETGFGYVKRGDALGQGYELSCFVEKPNKPTAEAYLAEGGYYWNAGIFLFRADRFLAELAEFRADIAIPLVSAFETGEWSGNRFRPGRDAWTAIEGESIDYAVAERTRKGAIIPVDMGWSDIGSWDAVHAHGEKDESGNVVISGASDRTVLRESKNTLVRTEGKRLIALSGCEDLVIIDTEDALYVGRRDEAQSVKEIVARLKDMGRDDLL